MPILYITDTMISKFIYTVFSRQKSYILNSFIDNDVIIINNNDGRELSYINARKNIENAFKNNLLDVSSSYGYGKYIPTERTFNLDIHIDGEKWTFIISTRYLFQKVIGINGSGKLNLFNHLFFGDNYMKN